VQPGGSASEAAKAMGPQMLDGIRRFVAAGGGYVGFCAGGFLATAKISTMGVPGLGILSGRTYPMSPWAIDALDDELAEIVWGGQRRTIFFQGGPKFLSGPDVEIRAEYITGDAAAVRAPYGNGRVYVSGVHPEATEEWNRSYVDPDGPDFEFALEMMHWASRRF
jgi:glutamine amidotransferase-like uncharacterized protein